MAKCSHSCKKHCKSKSSKRGRSRSRSAKQRRSRTRRHRGGAMKALSPSPV